MTVSQLADTPLENREAVILQLVNDTLDEYKAADVSVIDVTQQTTITDFMVVASGTSNRHLRTLAQELETRAKQAGFPPLGIEGKSDSEWILVDLADVIVHLMLPRTRDFYNIEKIWDTVPSARRAGAAADEEE